MIIREIKNNPLTHVASFDWFNDYKDTRLWAVEQKLDDIVALLDAGFKIWLTERNKAYV